MTHKKRIYLFVLGLTSILDIYAIRNIHRPLDPRLPEILISWTHNPMTCFRLKDSHLAKYPIFSFSINDMYNHLLPNDSISYRNNKAEKVDGQRLSELINKLLQEIQAHKETFTQFTVLQKKNFNARDVCGLIVLRFKEYPFVLKLFIETPETFIDRYGKGIEPICFFYMAGGANRHITGLTRIKNAEIVNNKITQMPQWNGIVETPRKWFWLPENPLLMQITGKNIEIGSVLTTTIPSVYGIIADAIEINQQINIPTKQKKKIVMSLCNDLDIFIDPHYNNFIFLPAQTPVCYKIVIVDTEHFPTIVGLKKKKTFRNHHSWYTYLGSKCFKDTYLHTKNSWYKRPDMAQKLSLF